MDTGGRSARDELLKVPAKVRLNHADEAAPENDIIALPERDDARCAFLEQHRPIERVEYQFPVKHYFAVSREEADTM